MLSRLHGLLTQLQPAARARSAIWGITSVVRTTAGSEASILTRRAISNVAAESGPSFSTTTDGRRSAMRSKVRRGVVKSTSHPCRTIASA
jgi:hypothetical protein